MIELAHVILNDEQSEQHRDLRVTEIFRRAAVNWERVHLHADPLVGRRSPADTAQLVCVPEPVKRPDTGSSP